MRVLVVDDSTLFRKIVRDSISSEKGVELVGSAPNGRVALEKIEHLRPDVVTLDVEMPELDGLEVLRQLRGRQEAPSVVMISSLTSNSAALTTRALALGAFDFILKPHTADFEDNLRQLRAELPAKLRLAAEFRAKSRGASWSLAPASTSDRYSVPTAVRVNGSSLRSSSGAEIVAIGVSTGGPAALAELLPKLPADFPVPIVVVQHMPAMFTRSLANELDCVCQISVQEAMDRQPLRAGHAYVAPGGRQMMVVQGAIGRQIAITDGAPEKSCKPSIDYLFRSLASLYGSKTLAIVLTGMGDDGTLGCKVLKRYGARVIAQDEASCVVYGMPRGVIEAGLADTVCSLSELHQPIFESIAQGVAPCS